MPCAKGSLNCTTNVGTHTTGVLSGFSTTAGYDLATGLGSLTEKSGEQLGHWDSGVYVNHHDFEHNPRQRGSPRDKPYLQLLRSCRPVVRQNRQVTLPCFQTPQPVTASTADSTDLFLRPRRGQLARPDQLTGGTYQVTARYGGDGNFAPSVSNRCTVTVGKAASTTNTAALIPVGNGNSPHFTTGAAPVTLFLVAAVNQGGNLLPTGTINFVDTVSGVATTVASNVGVNQVGEAFLASGISSLAVGSHSLVANYSGDASFNASSSAAFTFTITGSNPLPAVTTISPTTKTAGGAAFTLTVNGTNFIEGATVKFGANAALTPTFFSASQLQVTVPAGDIAAAGTPAVTVFNPTPGGGTSNGVTFTVNSSGTGTFTVNGSTPPAIAAGTSQVSTITVTPSGGFTGMVNVTCPTAGLPAGVTCTPNPLSINVTTAAAATGQLTVAVAAPSTTLTASAAPAERTLYAAGLTPAGGGKGWWTLSAGTGLAAMLLLFFPGRKRYNTALGLVIVCALSLALGCGGGGGGGGGGPVPTVTKLTLTAPAKVASGPGDTFAFTVAVTGGTPTGQVQLFDGATALGSPATVSGGSASITSNGLPVGTHSISAHYLGTTTTMASQSGAINATVTGTTNFVLSSTPGSSNANPTVSITIN